MGKKEVEEYEAKRCHVKKTLQATDGFEDRGGPQAKECRQLPETGKGKGTDHSTETSGRKAALSAT